MRTINLSRGNVDITIVENEGRNDSFEYKWINAPEMVEKLVETTITTSESMSEIMLLRWVFNIEETLSQL